MFSLYIAIFLPVDVFEKKKQQQKKTDEQVADS